MPNVGLGRAEKDGSLPRLPLGREHVEHAGHFGSIASLRARAVHLYISHAAGVDSARTEDLGEDGALGTGVRPRDALRLGRVVGIGAEDDAQDRVVVGDGILQPLEDHGADPFTAAVAVSSVVKRLAVSSAGEEVAAVQPGGEIRVC